MPGCRLTYSRIADWDAVMLSNDEVEFAFLPDKGAEIVAFVDRASGVDALFHAPWGHIRATLCHLRN